VDTAGRYVRLRGVQLAHAPSVVPPVFAGVRGPKSLQPSGRVAQGTILAEPVTPEYLAMAVKQVASAGHEFVAYNVASVDDDPPAARAQARAALAVVGEPDLQPHVAGLEFAAELAELRQSAGSAAAFAAALPDRWVDRLAIVGTPGTSPGPVGRPMERRRKPCGPHPGHPGSARRPRLACTAAQIA
jgi:5,10-methylenetetrahydromethanopterin reductase